MKKLIIIFFAMALAACATAPSNPTSLEDRVSKLEQVVLNEMERVDAIEAETSSEISRLDGDDIKIINGLRQEMMQIYMYMVGGGQEL